MFVLLSLSPHYDTRFLRMELLLLVTDKSLVNEHIKALKNYYGLTQLTQPHETQTPIEEEGYIRTNFYYEESREIIIRRSRPSPPLPSRHCHWRRGQVLTMRNGHPRLLSQLVEQWVLPKTARTGTTERTPEEQNSFCPSGYCALTTEVGVPARPC